ncbi:MAG: hypothetical protein JWO98_4446, partial [Frankiales bacterium]|nr:hypothetical protein [Frankiales bacterium]
APRGVDRAGRARPARARRRPGGGQPPHRVLGPDDDPDFLRELQRRARRDDSPA